MMDIQNNLKQGTVAWLKSVLERSIIELGTSQSGEPGAWLVVPPGVIGTEPHSIYLAGYIEAITSLADPSPWHGWLGIQLADEACRPRLAGIVLSNAANDLLDEVSLNVLKKLEEAFEEELAPVSYHLVQREENFDVT